MKFKNSPYYNIKFLGKSLYERIINNDEIFSVQEFFGINTGQIEYHIKETNKDYRLKVQDYYYELDCQKYQSYLYIVFDKPVHIVGKHCENIIAPEIIVKINKNISTAYCVTNKLIVDNACDEYFQITVSKINNMYFYNKEVNFWNSKIDNFFIFKKNLKFDKDSVFLDYCKIKCFGESVDLKENILNNENFKKGIIHIE